MLILLLAITGGHQQSIDLLKTFSMVYLTLQAALKLCAINALKTKFLLKLRARRPIHCLKVSKVVELHHGY